MSTDDGPVDKPPGARDSDIAEIEAWEQKMYQALPRGRRGDRDRRLIFAAGMAAGEVIRTVPPPKQTHNQDPKHNYRPERSPNYVTTLEWEVLPAGWWRDRAPTELGQRRLITPPIDRFQIERIEFLDSLCPRHWYAGKRMGKRWYFVALFNPVAVADSLEFGNAIYYLDLTRYPDWKSTFALTKRGALDHGAERVIHDSSGHWRERITSVVRLGESTPLGPYVSPGKPG